MHSSTRSAGEARGVSGLGETRTTRAGRTVAGCVELLEDVAAELVCAEEEDAVRRSGLGWSRGEPANGERRSRAEARSLGKHLVQAHHLRRVGR